MRGVTRHERWKRRKRALLAFDKLPVRFISSGTNDTNNAAVAAADLGWQRLPRLSLVPRPARSSRPVYSHSPPPLSIPMRPRGTHSFPLAATAAISLAPYTPRRSYMRVHVHLELPTHRPLARPIFSYSSTARPCLQPPPSSRSTRAFVIVYVVNSKHTRTRDFPLEYIYIYIHFYIKLPPPSESLLKA